MRGDQPSRSAQLAWGAVVIVLLAATGLVTYGLTHTSSPAAPAQHAVTSQGILDAVSTVPATVFDRIGTTVPGVVLAQPRMVAGQPTLTSHGRPEVLFIGAEYCPFCAAERWALVVALSRFGRFTVLGEATSAPLSVFPSTATFSFVGARYSSRYLAFTGVERYSAQVGADGKFTRIARLTSSQAALLAANPPAVSSSAIGAGPFVDIAGIMVATTSGFSPALLAGQSQAQIAGEVATPPVDGEEPATAVPPTGAAIIASANQLTVGLCAATGQRPMSVCRSKAVRDASQSLGAPAP